ncbi:hypothetical protein EDB84DRAFT_1489467 [Lactarius hengduanensis]|nr:hypothetical protein EDB84DRAFT_1489467 [Lactarius hengduanensis]
MTRRIQTEKDLAARVIGRCFGALVAKKLSADIDLPRVHANDERLVCLSAILGTDSRDVMSLLGKPGTIELAGIVSLMLVADSLVGDTIPPNVLDMFKQTLRILSRPLLTEGDLLLPPNQVELFHENYSRALESLNRNWLKDELQHVSDRLPSSSSTAQGGIPFPEPAQGSLSNDSHVSKQSRENQVRIGATPDSGIDDSSVHT